MDSNPLSPVRRTTLFETPLSQHARAPPPPSKTLAAPSSSCFFQFVDPVRMNSELTRQLGDRPVPPTAATTTPSLLITALCFFRVRFISCSCAVALSRG